jgi:hypothetical protein
MIPLSLRNGIPRSAIAGLWVTVFALHLIQKTHFYLRNVCLDCQGLR